MPRTIEVNDGKISYKNTARSKNAKSRDSRGFMLVRDDEFKTLEEQEVIFSCEPCGIEPFKATFPEGLKKMRNHRKTKLHRRNIDRRKMA